MWRLMEYLHGVLDTRFKRRKYIEVELDFPDHLERQPGETNEQHLMRLAIGIHEAIKEGGFIDPDVEQWEGELGEDQD